MRLALLGVDDEMLAVVAADLRGGQDRLVMLDALAPRASEAAAIAPQARLISDWEQALDRDAADAVLVAGDVPEKRIEQLRRLMQAEMPALVSHPVAMSMLDYYELDMIRREARSIVVPYLPGRWHPAAIEIQMLAASGEKSPVGSVEQLILERFLPQRQRDAVLRQFARDADLLQFIAGSATKLHALGSGSGAAPGGPYANLAVQMTCAAGTVCRWTIAPVEEQPGGRLTLVGSRGKAVLWMPQVGSWRLEVRSGNSTSSDEYPVWDPSTVALEKLAAAIDGTEPEPSWTEAARTVELADTIDRSLTRGRTIDLHQEEFTDIGTFKGTMTSVGCGLLVSGLVMVVVVAMVHSLAVQAGWNRLAEMLDGWPYLLLGVCGLFLLLQLFLFVGKSRQQQDAPARDDFRDS